MTRESEIELLMKDNCTKSEAIKHLNNGSIIFTDLEENLEGDLEEWDEEEEDKEEYRKMIENKSPLQDWGIVEDDGKTYYIMYVL